MPAEEVALQPDKASGPAQPMASERPTKARRVISRP
jgi:hypothetical protein